MAKFTARHIVDLDKETYEKLHSIGTVQVNDDIIFVCILNTATRFHLLCFAPDLNRYLPMFPANPELLKEEFQERPGRSGEITESKVFLNEGFLNCFLKFRTGFCKLFRLNLETMVWSWTPGFGVGVVFKSLTIGEKKYELVGTDSSINLMITKGEETLRKRLQFEKYLRYDMFQHNGEFFLQVMDQNKLTMKHYVFDHTGDLQFKGHVTICHPNTDFLCYYEEGGAIHQLGMMKPWKIERFEENTRLWKEVQRIDDCQVHLNKVYNSYKFGNRFFIPYCQTNVPYNHHIIECGIQVLDLKPSCMEMAIESMSAGIISETLSIGKKWQKMPRHLKENYFAVLERKIKDAKQSGNPL